MKKNIYFIGLLIFTIIFSVFLITNIFFRNIHYWNNSILLNAFFVPVVCTIGAFFSVISYSKEKKILSFKDAFSRAFIPTFVAGALSFSSIYLYINHLDTNTKDLLNYQFIENNKQEIQKGYEIEKKSLKKDSKKIVELEKKHIEDLIRLNEYIKRGENIVSLKNFSLVFAGYSLFFIILSVFFGSFFRTRTEQ